MNEDLILALKKLIAASNEVVNFNTIKFGRFEFIEAIRQAESFLNNNQPIQQ